MAINQQRLDKAIEQAIENLTDTSPTFPEFLEEICNILDVDSLDGQTVAALSDIFDESGLSDD